MSFPRFNITVLDGAAGYSVGAFALDDTSAYVLAYANQGIIKVPK